jgi:predicted nucleic acid binding AN1-type Zn finger protein
MEPFECPLCKGLFCLKHRLESDHNCKNKVKVTIADKYAEKRELARRKIEEAKMKLKKK